MSDATLPDPERWVEVYGDDLFRYALFRLRRRAAAEDVVQEAFLAALGARDSFDGRSAPKTWLIGILRHKIVDHFRRAGREVPASRVEAGDESEAHLFDDKGHWRGGRGPGAWPAEPLKLLMQKEFRKVLDGCLDTLPSGLAECFILREMEDLSSEEICKVLAITPTTLWVRLHRARARLRHCLESKEAGDAGGESR